MNPERWQRVKEVIDLASAANSFERARVVVKQACGDDVELQREVIRLLQVEEEMGDFIDEPLWTFVHPIKTTPQPLVEPGNFGVDRRVGPYRIDRVLGRGGMGTVYLASREDDYQQQVALKVVSWHVDSEQVMARFLNERQILANLRHSGIAQLLDGGTTEEGRPYLVMEYVEGQPIDVYCREKTLQIPERLRLFREVCELVHFAHRNLVIHRDLKPSNILVTADGLPKLLDFGIAKLIPLNDKSIDLDLTAAGPVPMTPSCASPEQFLDEPITTACDVYSLGVLLFHLLTDQPPYQLDGKSFAEMVKVICWQEPERPSLAVLSDEHRRPEEVQTLADGRLPKEGPGSSRLSRRSKLSDGDAVRLSQNLKGDLDAITLKALRKDPQERYGSAAEFGEDIERYLRGEAVGAHRGNWFYHWRKFARRNRYQLLVAAMLVGLIIGFTAVLSVQSERTRQMNHRSETLTAFWNDVLRAASPNRSKGRTITVQDLFASGSKLLSEGLKDDPEVHAGLLRTLAEVGSEQGNYEEASDFYREALAIESSIHEGDHPHKIRLDVDLASLAFDQGQYEEAERLYRQALDARLRLFGEDDPDSASLLNGLGSVLARQGRFEEAGEVFDRSLAARLQKYPPRHYKIATSLSTFGVAFFQQGQFELAESYLRRALDIRREARGLDHTETATTLHNLGRVLYNQNRLDEAEVLFREALEVRSKILGPDNVDVASTMRNLALLLLTRGDEEEALELVQDATPVLQQAYSDEDWRTAEARSILGACLSRLDRFAEAEPELLDSYVTLSAVMGEDSIYTLSALDRLKEHYEALGEPEGWTEALVLQTERKSSEPDTASLPS